MNGLKNNNIIQPHERRKFCLLMDLEDIMLSEISQTEKDKYCMFSLIESKKAKLTEIESRIMVTRVELGIGNNGEMLVKGYKLPA